MTKGRSFAEIIFVKIVKNNMSKKPIEDEELEEDEQEINDILSQKIK